MQNRIKTNKQLRRNKKRTRTNQTTKKQKKETETEVASTERSLTYAKDWVDLATPALLPPSREIVMIITLTPPSVKAAYSALRL